MYPHRGNCFATKLWKLCPNALTSDSCNILIWSAKRDENRLNLRPIQTHSTRKARPFLQKCTEMPISDRRNDRVDAGYIKTS